MPVKATDRNRGDQLLDFSNPLGTSSEGGQTQYVLTSADGQEVIIDAQALEGGGLVQGATVQVRFIAYNSL